MCGLAGEIACSTFPRVDVERALPMLQAILHRGPDGVGTWEDPSGNACLLHARLALVDIDGGMQPMALAGQDLVIAFNGELYGFERMRRDLERRGAVFRTRSDTEVLLHLYLHFGADFIGQLEGEFAFALVDRRKGITILARDRFGVKPLFTSVRKGLLLFGSEAKAILAHPWSERALNLAALQRELHGAYLPEDTVFAGVTAVEPGTYLQVSRQGITKHRHFRLEPEAVGSAALSFEQAADALEAALGEAVKERLRADVPVGVFLSSGVDSSSIAALAAAGAPSQIRAYSIDFAGTGESERAVTARNMDRLGLRGEFLEVTTEDLENAVEASIWHAETTTANLHGTAKMLLAGRAKREVKAVLTGEGSDELQGGYPYFEHAALLATAGELGPAALSRFVKRRGPSDGVMTAITPRLRTQMAWSNKGGVPYAALRARASEWGLRLMVTDEFSRHAETRPSQAILDWLTATYPDARILDDVTLSRLVSLHTDLPRYNLGFLGDRAEMANGLEARLPFLDSRVVDLMWRTPASFHRSHGEGKRVLRAVLARHLPSTAAAPKRSFLAPAAPSHDLLHGPLAERWLSRRATRQAGIYRPGVLAAVRQAERLNVGSPNLRFSLGVFLTMALSAHIIGDMFCSRFSETMNRHAAMSLSDLRLRLQRDRQSVARRMAN